MTTFNIASVRVRRYPGATSLIEGAVRARPCRYCGQVSEHVPGCRFDWPVPRNQKGSIESEAPGPQTKRRPRARSVRAPGREQRVKAVAVDRVNGASSALPRGW